MIHQVAFGVQAHGLVLTSHPLPGCHGRKVGHVLFDWKFHALLPLQFRSYWSVAVP